MRSVMEYVLKHLQRILLGTNGILLVMIGVFWLWGTSSWESPAAIVPDAAALTPFAVKRIGPDGAMLSAIVDRPLFVADRRSATAETEVAETIAPADIFNNISLVGIIGKGAESVVIVRVNGQTRRIRQGDQLEGWTLQETDGRTAWFGHGADQKRELVMRYAVQGGAVVSASGTAAPPAAAGGTTVAAPVPETPPPRASGTQQSTEDFVAARRARREALWRARGIK